MVSDLMQQVREMSLELHPSMLDDLGLLPTLLWHIERYTAQTGVHVAFQHSGLDGDLPPPVATAAYRIVQEALTNVARHAGVSEVTVRCWLDGAALHIGVEDQGRGFESGRAGAAASFGLTSMRERATHVGGELVVESAPGAGTRLSACLPLSAEEPRPNEHDDDPAGR